MKIQQQKLLNPLIRVDDNFATLLSIDADGSFNYEFRFFAKSKSAVKSSANIVRISIRKDLPLPPQDPFRPARESNDFRDMIKGLLVMEGKANDTKRNNASDVITTTNADLTAKINNSEASRENETSSTQKVISLRSVSSLKQDNTHQPVLQTMIFDHANTPTQRQMQATAIDLLFNKVDPSIAGTKYNCINSTAKAFAGIGHTARLVGNKGNTVDVPAVEKKQADLVTSLYQPSIQDFGSTNNINNSTLIPVISNAPVDLTANKKVLKILAKDIGMSDFNVVFELVNTSGTIIESITRRVNHGQLVNIFSIPCVPPRISISPVQFHGRNVIEIEQQDSRAQRIRILRKIIRTTEVLEGTDYQLVAEISVKKSDGLIKFTDIVNNSSTIIYRCIPVGFGGVLGSEFTNAIAPAVQASNAFRHKRTYAVSIFSKCILNGIEISISSIPADVIAVAVLRKDITLNETDFSFVKDDNPIKLTTTTADATFIDNDVKAKHVYEYTCKLFLNNGSIIDSTSVTLQKYISKTNSGIAIDISNFEVIKGNESVDVRFNVKSSITNEGLNDVHLALKKQGLEEYFADELLLERDKLQSLIAHSVIRINLTTGEKEDFGTFTGTTFIDSYEGGKKVVSRLRQGHRYRYIVSTLIRKAETMIEKLYRTEQDKSTGKFYSFKPSTFRHPLALSEGVLSTKESLIKNHAEDDFSFGYVGNIKEIDVTFESPLTKISDIFAKRIDRRTNSIKWSVDGRLSDIEHFILMKEILGQAKIIGKAHNISSNKSFEFFDYIEPDDIGEVTYKVIPVMSNYFRGSAGVSNIVKIIDIRSGDNA